jgi:sugar phosphate isomerase/epimerase
MRTVLDGRLAVLSSALPGWRPVDVIEAARESDVAGVEWAIGSGEAIAADADGLIAEVAAGCRDAGIAVCGACLQGPHGTLHEPGAIDRIVELAAGLGAPHLRIMPLPYRGGPVGDELATLGALLERVVEGAAQRGIRVLVEPAAGSIAPSPELVRRVIEPHPPDMVGAVYDPGSLIAEGHLAPGLAVATLGRYLQHVHVKNVSWDRSHSNGWRLRYASLDAGLVDWRVVSAVLADASYEGWMVIDHLPGAATRAELRDQVALARELLGSAKD